MDKIKPCPFCGAEPVIRQWPVTNTLYIECINRKCKMKPSTGLQNWTKIEAHIEAWNRRAVEDFPAADVRLVKEGHWVKARGDWCTPGGDPVWECSECGKGVHVYGIEHGTYGSGVADGQWVSCPNCGAMMGGADG